MTWRRFCSIGGINGFGKAANKRQALAIVLYLDAVGQPLAFQHPHIQQSVDQQMVNLRDQAIMLDAQIVNDDVIGAVAPMGLHFDGGLAFAQVALDDRIDLLTQAHDIVAGGGRVGHQALQRGNAGFAIFTGFENHRAT